MSPLPEAVAAMENFRRRLMSLDSRAASALIQAYGPIWSRLEARIDALLTEIEGKQVTLDQALRMQRLRELQRQVTAEMNRYIPTANSAITQAQRDAVALAQRGTRRVVQAALPDGIDMAMLSRAGINWNVLPADAFAAFVGIAGDGTPLRNLLEPLGPMARDGVLQGLGEGIALGQGPRETARLIRSRFGMPLTRSLTISRTETIRSFREASRTQLEANRAIVPKYIRRSAQDGDVCMACLALDGEESESGELFATHPNCRCSMIPKPISYRDLGLPVDEPERPITGAQDWFQAQSPVIQRQMMGPGRFAAWKAGEFDLGNMAQVRVDPTWGPTVSVKPLKEMVK